MYCIDDSTPRSRLRGRTTHAAWLAAAGGALVLLGACATAPAPAPKPAPAPATAPAPAAPPSTARAPAPAAVTPAPAPAAQAAAAGSKKPGSPRYVTLGAPPTPRNTDDLRLQMALRLVAAHPDTSYTARAPDRLLAIPVLEVELNADGSVRSINVLRKPTTGNEATALAIAAVRRAAPYGDVSRLPKPWKVVETFLFDDDLRFKPRTLDRN
ncbi:Energy transducer TonB [Rubrivivax sp. A210]|nr:Energy transducer TonB [Rubrivivax sp. A210]